MSVPDLGVYVHLPFCAHVCPYCDFTVEGVGSLGAGVERRYLDLVLLELERLRERFAAELEGRSLVTLYLGGGTPSMCSSSGLHRLIEAIRSAFPGEPEEVTLEVNPGLDDTARVSDWRALGVTRVSIGVQALEDRALRRLGRAHRAREARAGLERCLAAGFASVSVDLMYGIPDQGDAALLAGAEEVLRLGVPHVSTYALTLEPATPFARAVEEGRLRVPGAGAARRQGRRLRAMLEAGGCHAYEISSAARAGHASRHNSRYWTRRSVLGLGVSAASLLGDLRFQAPRDRKTWEAGLESGGLALQGVERLDEREQRRETLALGLRRRVGISRTDYRRRFGSLPERDFGAEIEELLEIELLCLRGDRLALTERGTQFADEVFLRFVGR